MEPITTAAVLGGALGLANQAVDLAKKIRDLRKEDADPELKHAIADLTNALSDLKLELADSKDRVAELIDERRELQQKLQQANLAGVLRGELEDGPGGFYHKGKGPHCMGCFHDRGKLILMQDGPELMRQMFRWECPSCQNKASE